MFISENHLKEMATAYIKNGILKKWRHSSNNDNHIYKILSDKAQFNELVTEDELNYIKGFNNVIIENENNIQFINFSGEIFKG